VCTRRPYEEGIKYPESVVKLIQELCGTCNKEKEWRGSLKKDMLRVTELYNKPRQSIF